MYEWWHNSIVEVLLNCCHCWVPCGLRGCKNRPGSFPGRMS